MKAKKYAINISFVLIFIAVVLIIVSAFVKNDKIEVLLNSFGFGIFGSAIVTFAISFGEYFVTAKKNLLDYYHIAYDVLVVFSKIKFFSFDEYTDLLFDFRKEYEYNKEMTAISSEFKPKSEAYNKLKECYVKNELVPNDLDKKDYIQIFNIEYQRELKKLNKVIEGYITVYDSSIRTLQECYSDLNFLTFIGKRKYIGVDKGENGILKDIHLTILNAKNKLIDVGSDFKNYFNADMKNPFIIYKMLKDIQPYFYTYTDSYKDDGYWRIYEESFLYDLALKIQHLFNNITGSDDVVDKKIYKGSIYKHKKDYEND